MTCFRQRQVEETRIGSHVEGEGVVGLQEVCSSSSLDRERHRAVEVSRFTPSSILWLFSKHLFLTAKPTCYLVNLSEKDYIRKVCLFGSSPIIVCFRRTSIWQRSRSGSTPTTRAASWFLSRKSSLLHVFIELFSGVFELKLQEMDPEQREAYSKEQGATSSLDKIVKTGYKALAVTLKFIGVKVNCVDLARVLLHQWKRRGSCLDYSKRNVGTKSSRSHSHWFRERIHHGRSDEVRRLDWIGQWKR